MTSQAAPILIIGGNSAIAGHLLALLPEARALARSGGGPRITPVGDYAELNASHFKGVRTVINCAGIVRGSETALYAVNVERQAALAAAARDAGAARYISIGSFSIFGSETRIGATTSLAPIDAYGRSKRDGEAALDRLQTDRFGVLSVAFPAIIGTTRIGKVERLLQMWRRLGAWPVPAGDICRAMIGTEGAARVLAHAAGDDHTGRVLAADPVPFGYRVAAQWLREDLGGAFRMVPLPQAGVTLLRRTSPSLYRSMMTDSMLDPASNYMIQSGLESSLRRELAASMRRGNVQQ